MPQSWHVYTSNSCFSKMMSDFMAWTLGTVFKEAKLEAPSVYYFLKFYVLEFEIRNQLKFNYIWKYFSSKNEISLKIQCLKDLRKKVFPNTTSGNRNLCNYFEKWFKNICWILKLVHLKTYQFYFSIFNTRETLAPKKMCTKYSERCGLKLKTTKVFFHI